MNQILTETVQAYVFATIVENTHLANFKKMERFLENGQHISTANQPKVFITKLGPGAEAGGHHTRKARYTQG